MKEISFEYCKKLAAKLWEELPANGGVFYLDDEDGNEFGSISLAPDYWADAYIWSDDNPEVKDEEMKETFIRDIGEMIEEIFYNA